nr:MAG TPA: hypothetical protein [Caudoviricetes sp.]
MDVFLTILSYRKVSFVSNYQKPSFTRRLSSSRKLIYTYKNLLLFLIDYY